MGSPELYVTLISERTSLTDPHDFIAPYGDFRFHRELLGYTDADVDAFRGDAMDHFLERFGVDFRDSPIDPASGMQMNGPFALMPMFFNFEMRAPYTSVHGVFDCPRPVLEGSLGLLVVGEGGVFHGTVGGETGRAAQLGDIVLYGHYFVDFDLDGDYTTFLYKGDSISRSDPTGTFAVNMALYSERYGDGRVEGRYDANSRSADGLPHVSTRSIISFPHRFDL